MSLIKCKECGGEMSSEAKACPKCGAPPPKRTSPISVVVAIMVTIGVVQCVGRESTPKIEEPVASSPAGPQLAATAIAPYAMTVTSIDVGGRRIVPGITLDDFISRFGFKRLAQDVSPDPRLPGSMVVIARHHEAGRDFALEWRRERDPGPYKLLAIRVP